MVFYYYQKAQNNKMTVVQSLLSNSKMTVVQSLSSKEAPPKVDCNNNALSLSDFDRIESAQEWTEKTGLTKEKIMNQIPERLTKRCAITSSMYWLRDIVYCSLIAFLFMWLRDFEFEMQLPNIITPSTLESQSITTLSFSMPHLLSEYRLVYYLFWATYAVIQGTAATGLWVIGHECGHGAFSDSDSLNDFVGFVTHTALLVPYHAWKFTHNKHHRFTNSLISGETHVPPAKPTLVHKFFACVTEMAENVVDMETGVIIVDCAGHLLFGWPAYLVANVTGGRVNWKGERLDKSLISDLTGAKSHFWSAGSSEIFPPHLHSRIQMSTVGVVAMLGMLIQWSRLFGFEHMFCWYFAPYLVVNSYLVLYTWLHHTDESIPHLGLESFTWLRGALSTVDRPYPWILDHCHHRIGSTHVCHHLFSKIPHYHAHEATECMKPVLGCLYRFDQRGIWEALKIASLRCQYVAGVEGVQFYRNVSAVGCRDTEKKIDEDAGNGNANKLEGTKVKK